MLYENHPDYKYYKKLKDEEDKEKLKIELGNYLLDHRNLGVRQIAKEFNIGKSTVHKYLHSLRYIDDDLYVQCRNILRNHRSN